MQIKAKEFDRVIDKLQMVVRDSGDKICWFYYKGKKTVKTMRSQGSGDLPCPDKIRQQLKVNEDQMRGLISCSFSLQNYVDLLKEKRIILDNEVPPSGNPSE